MPSTTKALFSVAAAGLLVMACGSDPSGGGGGFAEHSLGWAREIAHGVRNSEYPEGELFFILCPDINDQGEAEEGVPWLLYYAAPSDTANILAVMVEYYTGNPSISWQSATPYPLVELPDYNDAEPWIGAARDSLGTAYSDWEEYTLNVQGNTYEEFPLVLNVAVIQFMSPDTTGQVSVIVDADNDNVLLWLEY
jgi:hypothetical protein